MKKIPDSQDNPIDVLNIKLCEKVCPFFKTLRFTPNGITTLSLIFGLVSIYFIWNYNWIGFGISYYISYFFDCLDGHYARKYKMVSKGGDLYDHIKDITVILLLIATVIYRYKIIPGKKVIIIVTLTVVMTLLMMAQLGCQEKLYPKSESNSISLTKKLCIGDANKTIYITKWFGCGTWAVYIIILSYFLVKSRLQVF